MQLFVSGGAQTPEGAKLLRGDLVDATTNYEHYREGEGEDLYIDYDKAYYEDSVIQDAIDREIASAQAEAERLYNVSGKSYFDVTGSAEGIPNGDTENWQKAIGAHHIWGSGSSSVDDEGYMRMDITIHAIDKYNFNKGMSDIATGTPDEENGRFAVLGWAHSFMTYGQMHRTVRWKIGRLARPQIFRIYGGDTNMKKMVLYIAILSMAVITTMIYFYISNDHARDGDLKESIIRTDIDPIKTRFPRLGDFEKCLWQTHLIGGNRSIGPSSYRLVGYVVLKDEEFSKFVTQFNWEQADKVNTILSQEALGLTTKNWSYSKTFNDYVKSASFVGDFYLDLENKLIYFDVQK
ncbi:hypothetical protein [Paenibacillus sp. MBLB4367]|uniref:hypothetical protein n=1 Tax=Paenibacillus sp. MBLB4367 TaxID=3384767 RepID=UPI0039082116